VRKLPWNRIVSLVAFAVAMGYLEAVVVVYIRHLAGMVPVPPAETWPQVMAKLPPWLLPTEQTREAATLIMLGAVALAAGRDLREKLCVLLLIFGVWDLCYYAGLKVLLHWPARLTTPNLLFLIPRPWFAPVWMPMAISVGMIVVGLALWPRLTKRRR